MLSRCVQGLRVQEMTNGFIEPFEGRQAPADCCSTLSSTPEKLAHRTIWRCVRALFHTWARCTRRARTLRGTNDDRSRDVRAFQFKKARYCVLAAPPALTFTVLSLPEQASSSPAVQTSSLSFSADLLGLCSPCLARFR